MKRILFSALIVFAAQAVFAQGKADMWNTFAKTKFEPKYFENLEEYLFFPTFPADLKALEGKEVTMEGYYVPFAPEDGDYIIISKYPMSQCFFCGGGGPESVAEVRFAGALPRFKQDDLLKVKGRLKLNSEDTEHMPFILEQAVVLSE